MTHRTIHTYTESPCIPILSVYISPMPEWFRLEIGK